MSNPNAHRLPSATAANDQPVAVRPHALLTATGGGNQQQLQQQQQQRHSQVSSGSGSPTVGHHPLLGSAGQQQQSSHHRRNQHHLPQANSVNSNNNNNNNNSCNGATGNSKSSGNYQRGHQRRQSVARLLPDISKLRLLSWLVEASSELINCDIAIMDGVYAKLNRSRESLLFWSHGQQNQQQPPARPPAPTVQPVGNRLALVQQQQQQQKAQLKHKQEQRRRQIADEYQAARNHHSLPIACTSQQETTSLASMPTVPSGGQSVCDNNNTNSEDLICDSNQDASDDDDNSSAASSTTSSGIHGTSLSSGASDSSSSSSSTDEQVLAANSLTLVTKKQQPQQQPATIIMSSAEQLSEKIRRTVMEHNYLQSLLVNVIRQHDRQRDLMNQQRKRQMSIDQFNLSKFHQQQHQMQQRIDLADIADSLDDGCLCSCHSQPRDCGRLTPTTTTTTTGYKSSTLPANSSASSHQASTTSILSSPLNVIEAPARKARRMKKNRNGEMNREDLINLLGDKLCENCYETHYWLHDCALELMKPPASGNQSDLNAIIARRNATFIKLVQQEVRSTLSKSIELIDLIRKEIKLPESIKQKQLMRCFSTSIQLLTSVGNYVVPSQDISSFIPEVGQSQTTLFSLPSSDFDHLLLYPMTTTSSNHLHNNIHPAAQLTSLSMAQSTSGSNYHLAAAPDIPIRRRTNPRNRSASQTVTSSLPNQQPSRPLSEVHQQPISDKPGAESSSGASSNNSSASSSIARGTVQQSSLTRAQTSSAILDGKTSHDLSFEAIANLSRHGILFPNDAADRPKFWQSSKFNFIKKLLHVKQERLARQQSKDRRIYNNKVQNKYRLVMMDLTHFNKSQTLLTTENGVNSLLTSMRNVLEFGLYLTLKLY